jgi:hypothetical protein
MPMYSVGQRVRAANPSITITGTITDIGTADELSAGMLPADAGRDPNQVLYEVVADGQTAQDAFYADEISPL